MKKQNCNTCRYVVKCYGERTSPRNVVLNILACRIRMGIKTNESSRLLLDMVRPNLIKLVSRAVGMVGSGYINMEDAICDLESRIIECLIDENGGYQIGESAYLTEYLFGTNPKTGWVRKWILWNFSQQKRFYSKHNLSGTNPRSDTEDISEEERTAIAEFEHNDVMEDKHASQNIINLLMQIIDDGITLNANEHRVIAFCLSHANESNKSRLIDGAHIYLSNIMGVSRPRITRLYAVARKKLQQAAVERGVMLA